MDNLSAVTIVQQWQEAANRQEVARLLELSDAAIEIVGPRGIARGHALLAEWAERAGAHFTTLRIFTRNDTVVVAQHGIWRAVETDEVIGEARVASSFQVKGQRVVRVARYDLLEQALQDSGLTLSDEYTPNKFGHKLLPCVNKEVR